MRFLREGLRQTRIPVRACKISISNRIDLSKEGASKNRISGSNLKFSGSDRINFSKEGLRKNRISGSNLKFSGSHRIAFSREGPSENAISGSTHRLAFKILNFRMGKTGKTISRQQRCIFANIVPGPRCQTGNAKIGRTFVTAK